MPQCLLHKGEVGITLHKMRSQRMLQAVGMPLLGWQTCLSRNRLEDPEELSAVKSSAFMRSEHKIATIVRSLATKPSSHGPHQARAARDDGKAAVLF